MRTLSWMLDVVLTTWYFIRLRYHARRIGVFFGLSMTEVLDALENERRRLDRSANTRHE